MFIEMNSQKHLGKSIYKTCWNYNLCGLMRIYKNQIVDIDPKCRGSMQINSDQSQTILINKNLCRSLQYVGSEVA